MAGLSHTVMEGGPGGCCGVDNLSGHSLATGGALMGVGTNPGGAGVLLDVVVDVQLIRFITGLAPVQ